MREAFEYLKENLTTPPLLPFHDLNSIFVAESDDYYASLGVAISQKNTDGKLHPVKFTSRTMMEQERHYTTNEQEALAVVFALKKFRIYLLSDKPFVVEKNYQSLQTAFKKKDIHGKLASWMDLMTEVDLQIKYRSKKPNGADDYLSRRPVEELEASRGWNFTRGLVAIIQWDDPKLSGF